MGEENGKHYKLTHPQKRIYYLNELNSQSPLHNIGGCMKIFTKIDIDIMRITLKSIIEANDALRLRIIEQNNNIYQFISKYSEEYIQFLDFSNFIDKNTRFKEWSEKIFKEAFELKNSKLYYVAIYKISEEEYGVLFKMHHIIGDGWTFNLIQKEICSVYSDIYNKKYNDVITKYSYIDFIEEENKYFSSKRFIKNHMFWNEKFKKNFSSCLYRSLDSLQGSRRSFIINDELSHHIMKLIKKYRCSLNTFFICILSIFIYKTTNEEQLVIGTPVFNRTNKKARNIMGMFTSTVPFAFQLDKKLTIQELIMQVNKELKLCFLNQKYPYDLLVEELGINREGYDSLFKICVNYYNYKFINYINGIPVQAEEHYCGEQSYSLQVTIKEGFNEQLTINFDYKINEYQDNYILFMYHYMMEIIKNILRDEEITVNNINILPEKEIKYKVYTLNDTKCMYPQKTVYELFEEQVKRNPNKIAVQTENDQITYENLNKKSNKLANYLKGRHIYKESIIGIMMNHSIQEIIGILGILKAQAAYLPIDKKYPKERIEYMLEDSNASMILTDDYINKILDFKGEIVNINNINIESYDIKDLNHKNCFNDLAYVIYTSGSTGTPKGVMIEHKSLTNYVCWAKKMYLKDEDEIMPLYSSISFDLTVTSIFTPLISANKIIIYNDNEDEFVLYRILRENKVTVIKLTPAHLMLLSNLQNSNLKRIIVGGEDFKVDLAKRTYNNFRKNVEIFNEYGPTETVVGCMIHKYDIEDDKSISVPIGRPADNVQVYILNNNFEIVPTGIEGDIYISGDGVARGYLNRDMLTKEKFIDNPFINGRKMYKTGDTARYLENGIIEYLGRRDRQVKIRGHRIELEEIEKKLIQNNYIHDVIVQVEKKSLNNDILVAYIVSEKEIKESELRKRLLQFFPNYMIPTQFVYIDKIPLTSNGKIDYTSLNRPKYVEKEFVPARNTMERKVIEVMSEILEINNISINDNYYQIGGDSIKAIQISSKLKNIGLAIKVKDILSKEIIGDICSTVRKLENTSEISQELREGIIENTPIVEYFLSRNFVDESKYNQYIFLKYNKVLDKEVVNKALNKLINHHDTLRINFNKKDKKLYYNNSHLNESFSVEYIDLSTIEYKDLSVKDIVKNINNKVDISKDLLIDAKIYNLAQGKQGILFVVHHLIVDGVSWRIIIEDFINILEQLKNGNENLVLPFKTHSFKEWAMFIEEYSKKDLKKEYKYWNEICKYEREYSQCYLSEIGFYGENIDCINISSSLLNLKACIDTDTINSFRERMNEVYKLDFNESLIISLIITINKFTKKDRIIIELERHGREQINKNIEISRSIGWFTTLYPAYFKITENFFNEQIKSIKEQLRQIPNNGFDYGVFKFINKNIMDFKNNYIRFNYIGEFTNSIKNKYMDFTEVEFGLESGANNTLTYLLDIEVSMENKKLIINMNYSNNILKTKDVKEFINKYIQVIREINDLITQQKSIEFTPSDFQGVDISQEDLDKLFI